MAQRVEQVILQLKRRPAVLKLLSKEWAIPILLSLRDGLTFSEIKWRLGIGAKTLSARLKEIVARGLAVKTLIADVPVRVEYALTEPGQELASILAALGSWEKKWE
jgi:DNA-binding HxlR family transcriptional regulator